jgi:hypothetical protein
VRFEFLVAVELERSQGRFATRDEMQDQIIEAIEGADPGSLTGDNDGEYDVVAWDVQPQEPAKSKRGKA